MLSLSKLSGVLALAVLVSGSAGAMQAMSEDELGLSQAPVLVFLWMGFYTIKTRRRRRWVV